MEHQKISYEYRAYESVDVRSLFWVISHRSAESGTAGLEGINIHLYPWLDFDSEINCLKQQVFDNNCYAQNLTESIINDLISQHHCDIIDTTRESIPNLDYYVNLQNLSIFKIDTKQIKTIFVNTHCKPLSVEAIFVKIF